MPKKLVFTDDDHEFLFRFTERVRQKDQSLGFDPSTLNRIEMVFPREVFLPGTFRGGKKKWSLGFVFPRGMCFSPGIFSGEQKDKYVLRSQSIFCLPGTLPG